MTLAEQLLSKGRQEDKQRWLWLGKVQLLQQLMGKAITNDDDLSEAELKSRFLELERAYNEQHKHS